MDAEQFRIQGKIVELEGELRALGIYCHLKKDESSTDVRDHKYNLPSANKVATVPEELILRNNFQTVASNHIEVMSSQKFIEQPTGRDGIMEDDDVMTYEEDECWVEKDGRFKSYVIC